MKKGKDLKPHIGLYGRRNYGKSSLINVIAGQEIAIVSPEAGTTTDPVKKSLELQDFGPVVFIDTAGMDDKGMLGEKRVAKTRQSLHQIDLAILLIAENRWDREEEEWIEEFKRLEIPFLIVYNKSDLLPPRAGFLEKISQKLGVACIEFSAMKPQALNQLVEAIRKAIPERSYKQPGIIGDLMQADDWILLITPIDTEAPEGRMILPQVQLIRDVLDHDGVAIVLKESQVAAYLKNQIRKPALAITDSQIFKQANELVPADIPLTSFSIVLARLKGYFEAYVEGTRHLSRLKEGDRILILESCTHHVTCDDIGRYKIPGWLRTYSSLELSFDVVSGLDAFPRALTDYAMVIQCGGCVLTQKQVRNRIREAIAAGIPVSNYGMTIAFLHGVFERAVSFLKPLS